MTTPPSEAAAAHAPQEKQNGLDPSRSNRPAMDNKLVSRVQDAIDDHGRYAPRLKDLSIGYAAGKGVTEIEARKEICDLFQSQIGVSPQEYLEQHRAERGLSNEKQEKSMSRGR